MIAGTSNPPSASPKSDHDSPWKEALEHYFPEFLALLFPAIHAEIDWSKGVQFLDKEFQQIVREAKTTGNSSRLEIFRLIDWMIRLPEALEADFRQALYTYEEQQRMPYVTTVERAGIQKGLQQGEARTLLRQLTQKFGPEAAELEQLEAWLDRILTAETPETIFH